ncbi:MAG: hypothetical protein NTW60_01240 [Candidatus Wolfebacteria bacterium]|nr:hypothetical protein [Candidatus Wolfebacteria bacterium]
MIKISREQSFNRLDSLPDTLKDALFSDINANLIQNICLSQHLNENRTMEVGKLVGYIILGFIHSEDLAREITNELQINGQISAAISAEVDKKIFAPIREDLKKVYAPAPAASWGESNVIDLKAPPAPISIPQPAPFPSGIDSSKTEMLKNFAPQGAPMPIADAGPMILHEETKLKPATAGASRSLGGLFGFGRKPETSGSGYSSGNASGVAAQVKFGKENLSAPLAPKAPVNPAEQTPRIVHYTEFRTPLSLLGEIASSPVKDGPVSLNSVAPPVPPTPIPQGPVSFLGIPASGIPKPPQPPKPPAPQEIKQAEPQFSIPMSQISQSKIEEIKPSVNKTMPPEPLKIQPKPVPEKPKDETIVDLRTFQIGEK